MSDIPEDVMSAAQKAFDDAMVLSDQKDGDIVIALALMDARAKALDEADQICAKALSEGSPIHPIVVKYIAGIRNALAAVQSEAKLRSDIVNRLHREKINQMLGHPSNKQAVAELLYDAAIALSEAEKDARAKALEEAANVADEAAEMRERLFKENGGSINASKSAQALIIAANIRQLQSDER